MIALGEEDPNYLWELAQAYEEEERFEDAYEQYNQAYPSLKEDTDFLKAYGYFLVEDGKMKEGKNVLEEYLKHDPADTEMEDFVERLKER